MPIEGFVLGLGCLLLIVALMPLVASRLLIPICFKTYLKQ